MNRLQKQQFRNEKINLKNFISLQQLQLLQYSIFPKFINIFQSEKKEYWQKQFNHLLPNQSLGYKSDTDYLEQNNLNEIEIVKNSIEYSNLNVDIDDLEFLIKQFELFTHKNRIKIIKKENKFIPVYVEIINSLEYILNIKNLIKKYPKYDSNHLGTKHRTTSYKKLLEAQLNILKNRLDDVFFNIINEEETLKTEFQIKFIEHSLRDEYKNLPEWLNYADIYLGLDIPLFNFNKIDLIAIKQLLEFFNGIKTSKEELLNSVLFYLRTQSNIKDVEKYFLLADNLMNILMYFLADTIDDINAEKKKQTFIYTSEHIDKEFFVKTYISNLPIYSKKNSQPLEEQINIGIEAILGLQNIFQKDNPTIDEISNYKMAKNLLLSLKNFGFTKEEIKVCNHVFNFSQKNQIN